MKVATTISDTRSAVAEARRANKTIGLVPTMGALHQGHFSLIERAAKKCDFIVVSIFVNPTQFGPSEDLESYPRTLEADLAACEASGVDLVFAPGAEEMYPCKPLTGVAVDQLARTLCGRSRPWHFPGVCAVVAKLFNIVQPDRAYFGAKDFQQATIIKRMVTDLNFPIRIAVCPTVREADGLAISSRNAYLTPDERRQAASLHGALQLAERMIRRGQPSAAQVIETIRKHITANAPDGQIDYVQIVDPDELRDVESTDAPVLVALAVKFDQARLIDNVLVDAGGDKV